MTHALKKGCFRGVVFYIINTLIPEALRLM